MTCVYAVFTDDEDNPSVMHFVGTSLDSLNLDKIKKCISDDYHLVYLCKFDLVDGGLNLCTQLVGFHAEPELIEKHHIFKGTFDEFAIFLRGG